MGPGRIEDERIDGAISVVGVHGEHDLSTAPALGDRLDAALAEGLGVVVDLSAASFIDSSILKLILEARSRAIDHGAGFALVLSSGGEPAVRRVLDVTGLLDRLPVLDDRDQAIEAVRSGPGR